MKINAQLIVSNTLWSAGAQLCVMVANFLLLPIFIKHLSVEMFGVWAISTMILGYMGVFDFGFTQGLQKYIAQAWINKDRVELSRVVVTGTGVLFMLGLAIGIFSYFAAPAVAVFFDLESTNEQLAIELIQIGALFAIFLWPLKIVYVILTSTMHLKQRNLLQAFGSIFQITLLIALIYQGVGVVALKWVASGVDLTIALIGLLILRFYVPGISWHLRAFCFGQILKMHRFSLGLFYGAILALLSQELDQLLVVKFVGVAAVASYVVVTKPYFSIHAMTQMLFVALNPIVHNLNASKDRQRLVSFIHEGIRIRAIVSMFLGGVGFLFLPDFVQLWMGPSFESDVVWGQLLLLVVFSNTFGVLTQVAKNSGELSFCNVTATLKTLLNLLISIVLVVRFGVGGPILGTILANVILGDLILSWFLFRKLGIFPKNIYQTYLKILGAALSVVAIGFFVLSRMPADGWFKLCFYCGLLFILYVLILFLTGSLKGGRFWLQRIRGASNCL
jgi:O-antigen/teichoic acid export membrane protein